MNMEKRISIKRTFMILLAALMLFTICGTGLGTRNVYAASAGKVVKASNGVKQNGWLKVKGTQLVNKKGKAVVLRGMSSHGLQWYSDFTTKEAIGSTAAYGANVFRVAMYTEEGGYCSNKKKLLKKVYAAVDAAIDRNMYVIVDWHILNDGNPNKHKKAAKTFFKKVAKRYKNKPNVIYEICNEPNGGTSWKQIKSYANAVIPVIRKQSPKSIVLVGTPTWSQEVDKPAASPLKFKNVMYVCHFYAGTHTSWLRDRISDAMAKGAPIFVTEWGMSDASGGGGVYKKEAKRWMKFLKSKKISWCAWSLCDKNESSAVLKPGANAQNGIKKSEMSKAGKFVFTQF